MKTFYEDVSFKSTGSVYPNNNTILDCHTVLVNDSTHAVSTCSLAVHPKAENARILSASDMKKQYVDAWQRGDPDPFTKDEIAAARNLVNYTKPEDGFPN
jgi:hypothetical protein